MHLSVYGPTYHGAGLGEGGDLSRYSLYSSTSGATVHDQMTYQSPPNPQLHSGMLSQQDEAR